MNVYYIDDQSDHRVAQTTGRVRSKRQDERNSTSWQRRRRTSWNSMGVRKVMWAGRRQSGGVGGCSQAGVVCENLIVGSAFSEGMRTNTHTLLKEFLTWGVFRNFRSKYFHLSRWTLPRTGLTCCIIWLRFFLYLVPGQQTTIFVSYQYILWYHTRCVICFFSQMFLFGHQIIQNKID